MYKQVMICPIPADVDYKGLNEYTDLHLAANEGYINTCLFLLQK